MNGKPGSPSIDFRRMREADLPAVMEIERVAFSHPWSEEMIRRELLHEFSTVLLATDGVDGHILGFAVAWMVHDELQVLNVAVAAEARRRGVALAEQHIRLNPGDARAIYMAANGLVALGETERGREWAQGSFENSK